MHTNVVRADYALCEKLFRVLGHPRLLLLIYVKGFFDKLVVWFIFREEVLYEDNCFEQGDEYTQELFLIRYSL